MQTPDIQSPALRVPKYAMQTPDAKTVPHQESRVNRTDVQQ
jgi:hypothetical protein